METLVLGLRFEGGTLYIKGPATVQQMVDSGKQYDEFISIESFLSGLAWQPLMPLLKGYGDGTWGRVTSLGSILHPTEFDCRPNWHALMPKDEHGRPRYSIVLES